MEALSLFNIDSISEDFGEYLKKIISKPIKGFYFNFPALEKYWISKLPIGELTGKL